MGRLLALLAVFAPAATAAYLAAPTITGGDSGEYIAAAALLGNVHAPGNPVYLLLANLVSWVPFGDLSLRCNLFSAAALGGLGLIVYGASRQHLRSQTYDHPTSAALSALGLSVLAWGGSGVLRMATVTEVYVLQTLWAGGVLALLAAPSPPRLRIAAFLAGLGTGVHYSLLVLFPLVLAVSLLVGEEKRGTTLWRSWAAAGGLFVLGFSAFLYLPLRSLAEVPVDFGHPADPRQLLRNLGWADYTYRLSPDGRPAPFGLQLLWSAETLADQFPAAALLLLAPAALAALRSRFRWPLALLWSFGLLYVGGITWAHNYPSRDFVLAVAYKQLVPATACLGLLLGAGLLATSHSLRKRFPAMPGVRLAGPVLLLALAAGSVTRSLPHADHRDSHVVRDYHEQLLWSLPRGSLYFAHSDAYVFPLLPLRHVEGQRPDLHLVDRNGRYLDDPYRYEEAPEADLDSWRRSIEARLVLRLGAPVFVSAGSEPDVPGLAFHPWGLAQRGLPPGSSVPEPPAVLPLRAGRGRPQDLDYKAKMLLAAALSARAGNDLEALRAAVAEALSFAPENPALHIQAARIALASGSAEEAWRHFARATSVFPPLTSAWREWGQTLYEAGRHDEAFQVLSRGLVPSRPSDGHYFLLLGNAANRTGRPAEAVSAYLRALQVGADTAPLWYNLGVAHLRLGDPEAARTALARALLLDPNHGPSRVLLRELPAP